ncbi:MAG TPA: hypothetical protein VLB47_02640 [Solirubrobacteraceae bacterium]|nr:hypothetical protein [Solirubrobacteraceae bacterium]
MRRRVVVAAAAALCAGLAATLAATARQPAFVDPGTDARPDGCGRDYIEQTVRNAPTWVYVGDRGAPASGPPPPARRLEGRVLSRYETDLAVHPTPEDVPTIHRSYDLNLNVLPDPAYRELLGGSAVARSGNFAGRGESTGRVHVEREERSIPRFAWPEVGDRVALVGSWVWDCGHWTGGGERTEIHPLHALWVERNGGAPSPLSAAGESEGDLFLSGAKTFAGVEGDCAHTTKGAAAAFNACLLVEPAWRDVGGTYRFRLRVPAPPRPGARLRVRVVDAGSSAGAPRALARARGNGVDVSLAVPHDKRVVVAQRVLARWAGAPTSVHLRVRFTRLLVRRAMDPGCPGGRKTCGSKETTHGEQLSKPPGEWNVYVDAAGVWKTWGGGLLRARDGQVFGGGPVFDLHLVAGRPWRVFVFTRECDFGRLGNADGVGHALAPCPASSELGTFDGDDVPGIAVARFASPEAALGPHLLRPRRHGSTCPVVNRLGCYEIAFRVGRV